jgi:hypothetical protein
VDGGKLSSVLVSNVLNEEKKQQAIALGRLGWSLRQIQKAIGVRRETISVYLSVSAGIKHPHYCRFCRPRQRCLGGDAVGTLQQFLYLVV